MTETITFLGRELRRVPDPKGLEDLYGTTYKNETMYVGSPGDDYRCGFWFARVAYEGEILHVMAHSVRELESRVQQRMKDLLGRRMMKDFLERRDNT